MQRLEILLLCDRADRVGATVTDHIDALVGKSRHHVRAVDIFGGIPAGLDLSRFDVIVLHYTAFADADHYLPAQSRHRLTAACAIKAAFIQDEYRHVDRTIDLLRMLGIDIVFTCVPEGEIEKVYPADRLPGVRRVNVLTGYVDEKLLGQQTPPIAQRPIDVGYRGRMVPAWLGDLGQEKTEIARRFQSEAPKFGLKCDISCREEDRHYGENWIRFMTRCKAMLGVESGTSVVDFTGNIQTQVESHLRQDPETPYSVLRDRYFEKEQGRVSFNQISPRCFEAAALRTLMILYEGKYSGRLEAWRHYVPLKKDHSNMAEVVAALRDTNRAQEITDRAYHEVALAPENSYAALIEVFDGEIGIRHAQKPTLGVIPYGNREMDAAARPNFSSVARRWKLRVLTYAQLGLYRYILAGLPPERRDAIIARLYGLLRPVYRFLFR